MTYPPQQHDDAQRRAIPEPRQASGNGSAHTSSAADWAKTEEAIWVRQIWVDIRRRLLERLRLMSALHAEKAWVLRRARPIAPNALGLHYAYPDPKRKGFYKIATATRVLHQGEESEHLRYLLNRLAQHAKARYQKHRLNPLRDLCNRIIEIPARTEIFFIGISVSSLGTSDRSLTEALKAAAGFLHIKGRVITQLTDGTRLVLDRGAVTDDYDIKIHSNAYLGLTDGQYARDLEEDGLPSPEVWTHLDELVQVCHLADQQKETQTGEDTGPVDR